MSIHARLLAGTAALLLAAAAAEARELTIGLQDNEVSTTFRGVEAMAKKLEELSGGEITMKIFPSATLGDFKAMIQQVQAGELDLVVNGYPDMSYMIPEMKLIGAPYVVDDFDHLKTIVAGPWGQEMTAKIHDKGLTFLDVWYQGTRETTANKPINSIDDMKGLRLRTPNVPFLIAYAEAVGAIPAPVAFQEVYLALQTNQVDGEENPLPTIEAMKFYEVQKYIAMTNHFVGSAGISIGNDVWDSLTDEEKGWVKEAAIAGGEVCTDLTFQQEHDLVATFQDRGITISYPDTAPFRAAMQGYYDELEKEFGEGAIAKVRSEN